MAPSGEDEAKQIAYLKAKEDQQKAGNLGKKYGEGRKQAVDMAEIKRKEEEEKAKKLAEEQAAMNKLVQPPVGNMPVISNPMPNMGMTNPMNQPSLMPVMQTG